MTANFLGLYYLGDARFMLPNESKWALKTPIWLSEVVDRTRTLRVAQEALPVKSTATTPKGWLMPKALCLIGMVIAILVFLIFLVDLVFGLAGMLDYAPLRLSSMTMDIVFLVASGALAYMAFLTFKEQK